MDSQSCALVEFPGGYLPVSIRSLCKEHTDYRGAQYRRGIADRFDGGLRVCPVAFSRPRSDFHDPAEHIDAPIYRAHDSTLHTVSGAWLARLVETAHRAELVWRQRLLHLLAQTVLSYHSEGLVRCSQTRRRIGISNLLADRIAVVQACPGGRRRLRLSRHLE